MREMLWMSPLIKRSNGILAKSKSSSHEQSLDGVKSSRYRIVLKLPKTISWLPQPLAIRPPPTRTLPCFRGKRPKSVTPRSCGTAQSTPLAQTKFGLFAHGATLRMRSTERSTQQAAHQALALTEALTTDGAASPFLLGHSSPSVADSYNR